MAQCLKGWLVLVLNQHRFGLAPSDGLQPRLALKQRLSLEARAKVELNLLLSVVIKARCRLSDDEYFFTLKETITDLKADRSIIHDSSLRSKRSFLKWLLNRLVVDFGCFW